MQFLTFQEFQTSRGFKYRRPVGLTRAGAWISGAVLAVIVLFLLCFRTVEAGEVGIVTRFGEVNRTASSGVALKLPWPIEQLYTMDIRVQKEQQESSAATSDLQDVQATLALNYSLDGPTAIEVYKTIGPDYKERIIIPAVQESFKSASASYTAGQLITERAAVKAKAYDVIKSRLEKYGIHVVDLNIVSFNFSAEFNTAIEQKQVAQQNAEKAKQDLERIKVEAEQKITTATADAEAQRLQQQTLTPELLQKYAIDKWDGKLPTTQAGEGSIFNIPIKP